MDDTEILIMQLHREAEFYRQLGEHGEMVGLLLDAADRIGVLQAERDFFERHIERAP